MLSSLRLTRIVGVLAGLALFGCGSSTPVSPDQSNVPFSATDLVVGTGTVATPGTKVTVSYTGWLYNETAPDHKGNQFGSSTFSFILGDTGPQGTIPGFDQGVTGMKVGGSRRLIVPPALAYGATGNGPIPPNAALVFDVQLTTVQ